MALNVYKALPRDGTQLTLNGSYYLAVNITQSVRELTHSYRNRRMPIAVQDPSKEMEPQLQGHLIISQAAQQPSSGPRHDQCIRIHHASCPCGRRQMPWTFSMGSPQRQSKVDSAATRMPAVEDAQAVAWTIVIIPSKEYFSLQ